MKNIQDQKPGDGYQSKSLFKTIFIDNLAGVIVTLAVIGVVIYFLTK